MASAFGCSSEYLSWTFLTDGRYLDVSAAVSSVDLLFRKVEESEIDLQLAKLVQSSTPSDTASVLSHESSPVKPEIQIDDFNRVDIRVGRVLDVQRVPKADKLLQLSIDLGFEKRTVLSGIAEHFTPEEVVGRLVCVVANLAPRKMRGIESQGMILMAQDAAGKLIFVSPEPDSAPGSPIR
jgi:methionyl-tRNA synthetase